MNSSNLADYMKTGFGYILMLSFCILNYRFPSASPVRSLPSRCPLSESTENVPKVTENVFKLPYFSRRTPKKWEIRKCQVIDYFYLCGIFNSNFQKRKVLLM